MCSAHMWNFLRRTAGRGKEPHMLCGSRRHNDAAGRHVGAGRRRHRRAAVPPSSPPLLPVSSLTSTCYASLVEACAERGGTALDLAAVAPSPPGLGRLAAACGQGRGVPLELPAVPHLDPRKVRRSQERWRVRAPRFVLQGGRRAVQTGPSASTDRFQNASSKNRSGVMNHGRCRGSLRYGSRGSIPASN